MSSSLSSKDAIVLGRLFDPEAAPNSQIVIDQTIPSDSHIYDTELLARLRQQEKDTVMEIERQLKKGVDSDQHFDPESIAVLQDAVDSFDSIIKNHPNYASAYANRAQVRRLSLAPTTKPSEIVTQTTVLSDLQTAIELATPETPGAPISEANARLLASAYTQRATLYLALSKQLGEEQMNRMASSNGPESGGHAAHFEELASKDFFWGGRYGNPIAAAMGVRVNPYAKACGNIVRQAIDRETSLVLTQ